MQNLVLDRRKNPRIWRRLAALVLAAGLGGCGGGSGESNHGSGPTDAGADRVASGGSVGTGGGSGGSVATGGQSGMMSSGGNTGVVAGKSGGTGGLGEMAPTGGGGQGTAGAGGTEAGGGGAGAATGSGGDGAGAEAGGVTGGGGRSDGGAGGGASGGVGAGGTAGRPIETLHFSGRWNVQSGPRATTVNSGSYVTAQFTGTGITGKFDTAVNDSADLPTLAWSIDGTTTWSVAEVKATLSMASNLSSGMHTITMIARALDENKNRWSPPLTSSITFLGFDVTGGALVANVRPAQPKLEILGDSITEGVIVQGSSYMGHSGQCWRNDAVFSYPTQTGRALGADYRQVGFGSQGLLRAGKGGVPMANDSFNWFYKDVPRDNWQADMVVINQGTNDSSQSAAPFKSAYGTFLTTIRKAYPNAKILALRPFNGAQAAQIQAAVSAAGDSRMFYVDTTGWLGTADFTDHLHPNVQGSGKVTTQLVAAIKKIGFP